MQQAVVAVIPTFRPDENLVALARTLAQTMPVMVSDDASRCIADPILKECDETAGVSIMRHSHNRGIARGLNDGLRFAEGHGAQWLLTVDQDTTIPAEYVEALITDAERRMTLGLPVGAVGAEVIVDASGEMHYPLKSTAHGPITEELIQTGTLWSVSALGSAAGFNEELGIDAVDAAACLALRKHGFAICVARGTRIQHQIGAGRTMRVFGRDVMVTGHSPERRSSMLRNRLRLFPAEFGQSPRHAIRTLRRVTLNQGLGLIIERDRKAKAKGTFRALWPSQDG